MFYLREDIRSNPSYTTHKSDIKIWQHLTALRNSLHLYSSKHKKILILIDFNVKTEKSNVKLFCENYNLKNLIHSATCYKHLNKPTCICLILRNVPHMFQMTCVLETRLSDFI